VRPVRVLPAAKANIGHLKGYLEDLSPRAAQRAASTLSRALLSLADYPDRGAPASIPGYRQMVVRFGRDGFVIRYRVTSREIIVTRVFHGREQR
jgi:plasmid stabilization system protein ParE